MNKRHRTKIVREGQYVVEVEVELIDTGEGWSPYLTLEDAYKLDDVRAALRRGDIRTATRLGRVFTLTPEVKSQEAVATLPSAAINRRCYGINELGS